MNPAFLFMVALLPGDSIAKEEPKACAFMEMGFNEDFKEYASVEEGNWKSHSYFVQLDQISQEITEVGVALNKTSEKLDKLEAANTAPTDLEPDDPREGRKAVVSQRGALLQSRKKYGEASQKLVTKQCKIFIKAKNKLKKYNLLYVKKGCDTEIIKRAHAALKKRFTAAAGLFEDTCQEGDPDFESKTN